jgi:hypothetical protein
MLEIERRRLTLAGHGATELNTLMKRIEEFYSGYLLDRLPPREILARRPEFKSLWKGGPVVRAAPLGACADDWEKLGSGLPVRMAADRFR